MAELLGTNPTTVTNWELGQTEPEIRLLPGIIRFLGYAPIAPPQTVAAWIRAGRLIKGLSQEGLAAILGMDPGTIARWERGLGRPELFREHLQSVLGDDLGPTVR